jgi:hypothetical protein
MQGAFLDTMPRTDLKLAKFKPRQLYPILVPPKTCDIDADAYLGVAKHLLQPEAAGAF